MTSLADTREAYDRLAPFYDRFTAHHDYESWTSALLGVLNRFGGVGRRLLDVACGTGKSFVPFLDQGFSVVACDLSDRMVAEADRKAQGRARVLQADMRSLRDLGEFDLVVCLDDAINYLLERDDLVAAFKSIRRQMAPHALFLFDVNTLFSYRTFYASSSVVESDDIVLLWQGRGSSQLPVGALSEATIDAWARGNDGRWDRVTSCHVQRHYTKEVVTEALRDAELECVGIFGHHFDGKPVAGADEERHTKTVYVAKRRER